MNALPVLAFLLMILAVPLQAQNDTIRDPLALYMAPGKVQEFLAGYTGNWEMEARIRLKDGDQPQVSTSRATALMTLGNRFLEIKEYGSMLGQTYEGFILLGFNTATEEFSCIQASNLGTGLLTLSGRWSTAFQRIELYGRMKSPADMKPIWLRQNIIFTDTGHFRIENYDRREDRKEFMNAEYIFRRIP